MIIQTAKKQLLYEYINSTITVISGFISSFVVLGWLREELFAQYSLTTALIAILNILTSFGLYNYSVQYIKHSENISKSILTDALIIIEIFSFLATTILFLLINKENLSIFVLCVAISFQLSLIIGSRVEIIKLILANHKNSKKIATANFFSNISRLLILLIFILFRSLITSEYIFVVIIMPSLLAYCYIRRECYKVKINDFMPSFQNYRNLVNLKINLNSFIIFMKNSIKIYAASSINTLYQRLPIILLKNIGAGDVFLSAFSLADKTSTIIYLIPFNSYRVMLGRCDIKSKKSVEYTVSNYVKSSVIPCILIILATIALFTATSYFPLPAVYSVVFKILVILSFGIISITINCIFNLKAAIVNEKKIQIFNNLIKLGILALMYGLFSTLLGNYSIIGAIVIAPSLASLLSLLLLNRRYQSFVSSLD